MKIKKHGKLACHVWVLLVAKTATSGSTLQRNYPVAWRQPAIGRAPWRMRWRVRREKWLWTSFEKQSKWKKMKRNLRKLWLKKSEAIRVFGTLTVGHTRSNRKSSLHGPWLKINWEKKVNCTHRNVFDLAECLQGWTEGPCYI